MAVVDFRYVANCVHQGCDRTSVVLEVRVLAVPIWSDAEHETVEVDEHEHALSDDFQYYFRLHGLFFPNPDYRFSRGIQSLH